MARRSQLYYNGLHYQTGFGPAQLTGHGSGNVTTTAANAVVTVNRADGTLYVVASTSATPPAAADIVAGAGAGVVSAASQAVASTGQKTIPVSNLQPSTAYYFHFTHRNPSGWDASRVSSAQFTTQADAGLTEYYFSAAGNDTTGDGTQGTPFQSVAKANSLTLDPGDTLYFNRDDSFPGWLQITQTDITVRDYGTGAKPVLERITMSGANYELLNLDVDQAKGASNPITIEGADNGTITACVIHDSTNNGIDIRDSTGTIIDGCEIYNCLKGAYTDVTNPDAHGVVVTIDGGVATISILNTEIHHVSGDSFQVSPDRNETNFDITVNIQDCTFWTGPLAANFNAGWPAGVSPGENAIDTKSDVNTNNHITLNLTNVTAHGFNMTDTVATALTRRSVFNLKENIDATLNRVTVYNSDVGFRIRGNEGLGGATVTVMNAVVYDTDKTFRIESLPANLKVYNCTFGAPGTTFWETVAGGLGTGSDLRNNAFLGTKPTDFSHATNINATSADFNDSANDDYRLAVGSDLIDVGDTIAAVTVDRNGVTRNSDISGYEVGAFDGYVADLSADHAYWEMLSGHANVHYSLAGRSNAEVHPLAWGQPANYDPTRLNYDPVVDAMTAIFPVNNGNAVQWGPGVGGRNTFAGLGSGAGTVLYYWESRWDSVWADKDASGEVGGLRVHKGFVLRGNLSDDRTLEARNLYHLVNEGDVSLTDIRQYGSSSGGVGTSVFSYDSADLGPLNADVTIKPLVWTYFWVLVDFGNSEVTYWIADENRAAVKHIDSAPVTINGSLQFNGFYFRHNSSQSRVGPETYIWDRNLAVLSGLTKAQVQTLVDQR